ncbi:MAG: hypothetical protein HYX96_03450 [Chloroflexi bacterium]|nr:hypothetical protein [Chloroflexota bacterium]
MFGKKKTAETVEKLPGPGAIPNFIQRSLVTDYKMDAELAALLKSVVFRSGNNGTGIRIFDESEALAKKVAVKDFTTLEAHPDLVIYEGSYDEGSKKLKLEEKKKVSADTPIYTEHEIRQKIEAMTEPGSTVFFYMAAGPTHGGPLGMGAAVIELNAAYPGKHQKKYIAYMADVVDMLPVGKGQKLFDTDKAKDVASWVKNAHHKRMYSA